MFQSFCLVPCIVPAPIPPGYEKEQRVRTTVAVNNSAKRHAIKLRHFVKAHGRRWHKCFIFCHVLATKMYARHSIVNYLRPQANLTF